MVLDKQIKRHKIHFGDILDVHGSKSPGYKIRFRHPMIILIQPNSYYTTFHPKSKMDPLECYTFKEAIDKETSFTRSQSKEYLKLLGNLKIISNLVPHYKPESKKGLRQTAQIYEPLQGGNASLKFSMLLCAEEAKLRVRKDCFKIS